VVGVSRDLHHDGRVALPGAQRGALRHLGRRVDAERVRAADLLAVRSTEQLVGGQPERLAHHVPEREVDAGLRDEVARKRVVQLLVDAPELHCHRSQPFDWYCGAISYVVIAMTTVAPETIAASRLHAFAVAVLERVGMD